MTKYKVFGVVTAGATTDDYEFEINAKDRSQLHGEVATRLFQKYGTPHLEYGIDRIEEVEDG